jgi:hypothetical protein
VTSPREVDVGPASLVMVVEPGDIGLDAVHRRHLEGGRGRRHAHRHRPEPGFPALDEASEDRHVPARQGVVEDGARQPVDLDDQQAPPIAHGCGAQPETPHQPVDRRLGPKKEIVRSHALGGAPPQRSLGAGGASSRDGGGAGARAGATGR